MSDTTRLGGIGTINRKRWTFVACLSITFMALVTIAIRVDMGAAIRSVARVPLEAVAAATGLLLIGSLLSGLRFWFIARDVGKPLRMTEAIAAMAIGQAAGALTVQVFGQIASRSAYLHQHGHGLHVNIVTSLYERGAAVAISLALACIGAWNLHGHVALNLQAGGGQLIRIVIGLGLAVVAAAVFAWGRSALAVLTPAFHWKAGLRLGRVVLVSLAIQLATAAAYVLLSKGLAPQIPTSSIFFAALVVMFAASLPISLAGWGVREISAVLALSAVGMSPSDAVAVAVIIGLVALGCIAIISAFALLPTAPLDSVPVTTRHVSSAFLEPVVVYGVVLATATAVLFQIYVPSGAGYLSVNLADPLAVISAGLFGWMVVQGRLTPVWRLAHLPWWVAALTLVIILSFVHGWFQFGVTSWAWQNRLIGWFLLLAFGATGALIVSFAGQAGLRLLAASFVASNAAIALLEVMFILMAGLDIPRLDPSWLTPIQGFLQNRNAFSFALLIAICALPLCDARLRRWAFPVLLAALWFAGSRAGLGALVVVLALAWWLQVITSRSLGVAIGASAFIVGVVLTLPGLLPIGSIAARSSVVVFMTSPETSNIERLYSLREAWRMFAECPLIGAGLGAFMAEQTRIAKPLVIHSTAMWLLAETGLLGFLIFAAAGLQIAASEFRQNDQVSKVTILIGVTFVVMSTVHELLYQRIFWLFLGATLACPPSLSIRRT